MKLQIENQIVNRKRESNLTTRAVKLYWPLALALIVLALPIRTMDAKQTNIESDEQPITADNPEMLNPDYWKRIISVDKDNAQAWHNIGVLYEYGQGVETNIEQAIEHYNKAVDLQYTPSMFNLGTIYASQKKYKLARELWKKAGDIGMPRALYNLGILYEKGWGVKVDLKEAMTLYRKSAILSIESNNTPDNLGINEGNVVNQAGNNVKGTATTNKKITEKSPEKKQKKEQISASAENIMVSDRLSSGEISLSPDNQRDSVILMAQQVSQNQKNGSQLVLEKNNQTKERPASGENNITFETNSLDMNTANSNNKQTKSSNNVDISNVNILSRQNTDTSEQPPAVISLPTGSYSDINLDKNDTNAKKTNTKAAMGAIKASQKNKKPYNKLLDMAPDTTSSRTDKKTKNIKTAANKTNRTGVMPNNNNGGLSWLYSQPKNYYTLQLAALRYQYELDEFLTKHNLSDKVHVLSAVTGKVTYKKIFMGNFKTKDEANRARSKLPNALKKKGSWVRRLASLYAELP